MVLPQPHGVMEQRSGGDGAFGQRWQKRKYAHVVCWLGWSSPRRASSVQFV